MLFICVGVWAAKNKDQHQWIQADLQTAHRIISVTTQGRTYKNDQWVKSYYVRYSQDGTRVAEELASQGDLESALKVWERMLTFLPEEAGMKAKSFISTQMAKVLAQQGEFEYAAELLNRAYQYYERAEDGAKQAETLLHLAVVAELQGDFNLASKRLRQASEFYQRPGQTASMGRT